VTEGGYDLQALAASLDAVIATLASPSPEADWPTSGIESGRGRDAIEACRRPLTRFWTLG